MLVLSSSVKHSWHLVNCLICYPSVIFCPGAVLMLFVDYKRKLYLVCCVMWRHTAQCRAQQPASKGEWSLVIYFQTLHYSSTTCLSHDDRGRVVRVDTEGGRHGWKWTCFTIEIEINWFSPVATAVDSAGLGEEIWTDWHRTCVSV